MKNSLTQNLVFSAMLLFSHQSVFSQGFVNLDFESAKIIPLVGNPFYPYGIATTNALPGWIVTDYGSTNAGSYITYNDPATGSSWVTLWATNGQQISGHFSVLLQGGIGTGVSLSQTGLVPVSAYSILFEADPGNGTLQLSLGGQYLSFSAIETGANYTLYGANIPSGMNGQIEQLMFSAIGYNGSGGVNNWNIDSIQFSPSGVPEPCIWTLTSLGSLLLARRRRKARAT